MAPAQVDATDHALAAELATGAGRLLLELRERLKAGEDPKDVKDAGDAASHSWLTGQLAQRRPNDAVLSEEAVADPARLIAERLWIIDPLDGTREFGEVGRSDWAVHVALVVGGEPVAGAVALPGMDIDVEHRGHSVGPRHRRSCPGGAREPNPASGVVAVARGRTRRDAASDGIRWREGDGGGAR